MTTPATPSRGCILLVEDEAFLLDTERIVLERAGWTVATARNGAEGLEVARDLDYAIDLVIADVVMPVMSGREMVRVMRAERPGLRIIMTTGFESTTLADDPDLAGLRWLEKPVPPLKLLAAIDTELKR